MLSEQRVRQIIRTAIGGRGKTWAPQLTTHQRRHLPGLQRVLEEDGALAAEGSFFAYDMFFIWYRADVDPDAVGAPYTWTEHLNGFVAHSHANGIFAMDDNVDANYLFYTFGVPALDNAVGTVFEARVRVASGSAAVNTGAAMSIYDGGCQFTLWLRDDGFNLDGEPDCPLDMTTFHRVKLIGKGTGSEVWVDGQLRQRGPFMNWSGKKQVLFGSYVDEP